jgi:hypothetical protein
MVAKSVGALFERRLWSKVEKSDEGCWLWLASVTGGGYGRFKHSGRMHVAHRVVYEQMVGPIPAGLTLDHLCRNRRCVRPDHLEPVTMRENVLRGNTITAANSKKTHCVRGHHLSGEALLIRRDGRRRCQICEYASQRRLRQKPEFKQRHAAYERMRRAIRKGSKS